MLENLSKNQSNVSDSDEYGQVHLTSKEIVNCRKELSGLVIAPFDETKAKGVGYNLSLSEMIYSISRNRLVPICHEAQETFFYLHSCETILALSYESIETDKCTAGSFHSRVRVTAQGIGSISTTLDPEWHGMLLFSLNNPTRKKIKVVLSKRIDGIIKPNPMITLIAWKTSEKSSEDNPLLLRLDNPPMRSDIWSELTTKSLRLFRNNKYSQFCKLVESLSSFNFVPSSNIQWVSQLSELLIELRVAIEANKSEEEARAALVRIRSFNTDTLPNIYNANILPQVLKEDLDNLTQKLELNENEDFMKSISSDYEATIALTEREIQYQLLCDQINQIHEEIRKQVPDSWHRNKFAHIRKILLDNIVLLISTVASIILIIISWHAETSILFSIIAAILPFVLSVSYELLSKNTKK